MNRLIEKKLIIVMQNRAVLKAGLHPTFLGMYSDTEFYSKFVEKLKSFNCSNFSSWEL